MTEKWQDMLCAGLLSMGAVEQNPTRKFRVFSFATTQRKFFVGKHGALRVGMTVVTCVSFGNPRYKTRLYMKILQGKPQDFLFRGD